MGVVVSIGARVVGSVVGRGEEGGRMEGREMGKEVGERKSDKMLWRREESAWTCAAGCEGSV